MYVWTKQFHSIKTRNLFSGQRVFLLIRIDLSVFDLLSLYRVCCVTLYVFSNITCYASPVQPPPITSLFFFLRSSSSAVAVWCSVIPQQSLLTRDVENGCLHAWYCSVAEAGQVFWCVATCMHAWVCPLAACCYYRRLQHVLDSQSKGQVEVQLT
jgi:hypothetical protein